MVGWEEVLWVLEGWEIAWGRDLYFCEWGETAWGMDGWEA